MSALRGVSEDTHATKAGHLNLWMCWMLGIISNPRISTIAYILEWSK